MKIKLSTYFLLMSSMVGHAQSKINPVVYNQNQILLKNIRIIDVENRKVLEGHSILISDGIIIGIGKVGALNASESTLRIDMANKTVLPGLVMLHEHMSYFSGHAVWDAHPISFPKLYLAAGVTTLRTAGAENPTYDLNLKRRIIKGQVPGPNIFVTGPMFNDASADFLGDFTLANYAEAREATTFWAERGCTSFKVYTDISREALQGVIDEAHARGLIVTGHLGKMSCSEAAKLGIDNIEHGFGSCASDLGFLDKDTWDLHPDDKNVLELIDLLIENEVVLTVTPFSDSDFGDAELLEYLSTDERKRIETFIKDKPPHLPREANDVQLRALEKLFVKKGGRIVLGADASDFGLIPGFQNHNVLISMVKGGWSPLEVIKMATIDGATFLKMQHKLGSIEIGKSADLIIVNGKPDQHINDIKNIELVFKNGIGYDSKSMREGVKGLVGRH